MPKLVVRPKNKSEMVRCAFRARADGVDQLRDIAEFEGVTLNRLYTVLLEHGVTKQPGRNKTLQQKPRTKGVLLKRSAVYITPELADRLKEIAKKADVSLTRLIVHLFDLGLTNLAKAK
jgi:hypothetical protein